MISVKQYKKKTECTVKQAKIAIMYFEFLMKKRKEASVCPKCGGELDFDSASYNDGYGDCICCNNCDFRSDIEGDYKYLTPWYGFDPCLYNSKLFTPKKRKEMMRNITKERLIEMQSSQ